MSNSNFLQRVVAFIRNLLEPVVRGVTDEEVRRQILLALNLNPTQSSTPITIPADALSSIDDYQRANADDVDIEAFLSVINDLAQVANALENFISAAAAGDPEAAAEELITAYLDILLINYVRVRNPGFYITLNTLKLIQEQSVRHGGLVKFFTQTGQFLEELYGESRDLKTEEHAKNLSDGVLFIIGVLATKFLKAEIAYGFDADPGSASPIADGISDRSLTLKFAGETKDDDDNVVKGEVLTSWAFIPRDHQGPGLLLHFKGSGSLEVPLGRKISLTIGVDAPDAFAFLGDGNLDFPGSTDAGLSLKLKHKSAGEDKAIIGSPEGTHLLFGQTELEGKLSFKDYSIKAGTKKSSLTIAGQDADSFIRKTLPSGKIKIDFSLLLGYSQNRGFFIEGGAGFLVAIPLHKEIGPLNLQTLTIGFKAGYKEVAQIDLEASLAFSLTLGPLTAVVDRIGLASGVAFPVEDGNVGKANIDFDFKPPNGVGLAVDGGAIRGGGFLSFEPDLSRYAGVLELTFSETVSLKAIGLLTTKMPDGSDGFSLLIIISAEFQAIQLGFGFTLNGVGGLLGLNRTVKIDVLRQGIKNNALTSVLFPTDIVANAPRIISDLRQIFPPESGKFVFGPMAKLGWGTPTLITIELGLIIEVPEPVRIALLGVVKAILPEERSAILKFQVNFIGAWEQDKRLISFDAGLFDSRLLAFPLAGDLAFRLKYGDEANFLYTVGGFHPAYTPPPLALPDIVRLSLSLTSGNNPRLTLQLYYAITSNTVQFGAKIELMAKAWKFSIHGFLAMDALFQFSPFYFIVGISGGVAVKAGSSVLFSIGLKLSLSGPTPWNAKGKASFKILFVKIKVRFNKTWGEDRDTTLPDTAVMPLLTQALNDSGNWEARLPARNQLLVSLREMKNLNQNDIVAHPAGVLTVKQKIVPLDMTIDRFGQQRPSDAKRFTIKKVYSDTFEFKKTTAQEQFAPAQFEDMSDAQKLSRKSFENMPAGVTASAQDNSLQSSRVVPRKVGYETIILDTRFPVLRLVVKLAERMQTFFALLRGSGIAKSDLSHVKNADAVLGPGKISAPQEGYSVVGVADLFPFDGNSVFESQAGAHNHMRELIKSNPALNSEIQVVPNYEVQQAA
jgi:hypothetical protein